MASYTRIVRTCVAVFLFALRPPYIGAGPLGVPKSAGGLEGGEGVGSGSSSIMRRLGMSWGQLNRLRRKLRGYVSHGSPITRYEDTHQSYSQR